MPDMIGDLTRLEQLIAQPKVQIKKDERTRHWTFVLYPESAPENWKSILDDLHVEWICSPLHDKDINANGEPKKPHFHVILSFDGNKKSFDQVVKIIEPFNCPGYAEPVLAMSAMIRYLVHRDNPDKAQYDTKDITLGGGVDLFKYFQPSSIERYNYIKEMCMFVTENDILEFQDLLDYAMLNRFDDWFRLLIDNCTLVMTRYIASRRRKYVADISEMKYDDD